MDATITISGTMMALLIMCWYIGYRGEIHGRFRLLIFAFAAASLPFVAALAQRFWQLIDNGLQAAQHARGAATGLGMLFVSLGGIPW